MGVTQAISHQMHLQCNDKNAFKRLLFQCVSRAGLACEKYKSVDTNLTQREQNSLHRMQSTAAPCQAPFTTEYSIHRHMHCFNFLVNWDQHNIHIVPKAPASEKHSIFVPWKVALCFARLCSPGLYYNWMQPKSVLDSSNTDFARETTTLYCMLHPWQMDDYACWLSALWQKTPPSEATTSEQYMTYSRHCRHTSSLQLQPNAALRSKLQSRWFYCWGWPNSLAIIEAFL